MMAATTALEALMIDTERRGRIAADALLNAHSALLGAEPSERDHAGRWRDGQSWIGGSDYSPRDAFYVPPPPDTITSYMDDLLTFAHRSDWPILAQAAVAHAQFESIHPFTDGNGRIGRALINAILRRRRATTRVVVPVASALVAHRDRYFELLDAYRDGDLEPLVRSFAIASRIAAGESRTTARRLSEIPAEWRDMLGRVRAGSATAKVLTLLPARPVPTVDETVTMVGGAVSSVYAAVDRLHAAGILRPLTKRTRNQVWGASLVLDELDDLGVRIARAAR